METINRITCNKGEFVGALSKNVIRVIGSYGGEYEPDEFGERYRRGAEEITALKEEQIGVRHKKKKVDSYEQWLKDMDSFRQKQSAKYRNFIMTL